MRYVLLLESAYDNGKLCSFSHRAFRLWANSLSYARKHRTDGYLSHAQAAVLLRLYQLTQRDADELVEKGGWERVATGYRIHDFLEVNPSEEELGTVNGARSEAGRLGGLRSAETRRRRAGVEANASKQTEPASEANAKQSPSYIDIERDLEGERDPEDPTTTPAVPPAVAPDRPPGRPAGRGGQGYTDEFLTWWDVYPRHDAKLPASEAYQKRRDAGRSPEVLLAAARHLTTYVDEFSTPTEKIPHATTFLNQHRDEQWETGPPDADRTARVNGNATPRSWDALRNVRDRRIAAAGAGS